MAKEKKYRCLNVGNCEKADKKEPFTIPEGEDLKCPDCHSDMVQEVKGGGMPGWLIGLVAVGVVAICAIVFWPKSENKAETSDTETEMVDDDEDYSDDEGMEEPEDDGEGDNDEVVPDTVVVEKTDTVTLVQTDTVVVEKTVVKEKTVASSNSLNNYNLGWGLYTGPAQGGKPHGTGEVNVTKSYSIDLKSGGKTLPVDKGDRIISARFKEGKLVGGTIKYANGSTKKFDIGV